MKDRILDHELKLANLVAYERLDGLSRYETRLLNRRKELLAMILKFQEQQA